MLDLDYGEGWVKIGWTSPSGVDALLQIDADGFCSREMPIRSGHGPPQIAEVRKDGIHLRFSSELAKKLELDVDVDFLCDLSEKVYDDLCKLKELFSEP